MKEISVTGIDQPCLVDDDDYWFLRRFSWFLCNGYAAIHSNGTKFYMHRVLLLCGKGMEVDHINFNRLDNRRHNLRCATRLENARNGRKRNPNKRFKGVWTNANGRRWYATITANKKSIYLGSFDDEDSAARAYDRAALEHFGEFAQTNFPIDDYKQPASGGSAQ